MKLPNFRRRNRHQRGNTPVPQPHFIDALPIGPGLIYPDMLPENVWGSNLRGILPKADWDRLRIPVCEAAGNRCEVCSQPGYDPDTGRQRRPDCHELWHFEVTSTSAVQRLARLVALCPDCHRVQHAGRASVRGELSKVVGQLRAVNSWNHSEVRQALHNAEERYRWRRQFNWDLDLTLLAGKMRVARCPNLVVPASERTRLGNSFDTE
ncbi:hypothetical protein [Glycomyces algeriensis]|uniref:HNH endonuclease n=1 Tax=Glycomyces algeriensis TaxID=256037 RepID=A0A9W6LII9_9ACTN|nr:hypothetical protein [Glycomyces algeriensis]MDA1368596.1 hypothetical protein [Glycomyces algeriensis]MDR7352395.1 hypothetical protein [Glycomyces algeriensis]GLI45132.1 hypothetical protein GALLR39Z86_49820 [Glycomyces algeriensis]